MGNNEKPQIGFENARNFVINNILLILSNRIDNIIMKFGRAEKEGKKRRILIISSTGSEKDSYIDLDILDDDYLAFLEKFLSDIVNLPEKYAMIQVSRYYLIESDEELFSGLDVESIYGDRIRINLECTGKEFNQIISKYTDCYNKILELKGYNINNI